MEKTKVYAFDLGSGSLASCVRDGDNVLHLDSETLPGDYATLKESRERRRQIRTRIAHQKREEWWKKCAQEAGIEVLETGHLDENGNYIPPDPRISREFSKEDDPTIYNSLLLRIALLQGEQLEGWQIYKAVWSAIQRRGYDTELPWKNKLKELEEEEEEQETGKKKKTKKKDENSDQKFDEKEIEEAIKNYEEKLKEAFGEKEEFYYPSYLEAYHLGIWSPDEPTNYSGKLHDNPTSIRNKDGEIKFVAPRKLVEKELIQLLTQAGKQYPYLEKNLKRILYGPSECKYGAYLQPEYRKFLGKDWEWQGLLSQKTPRFDNRIISKCRLIPRLNVCKRKDPLCKEVTFLLQLKNFRYVDIETGEIKALTPDEIKQMYEHFKDELKISKKQLKNYVEKNLYGILHPNFQEIPGPKVSGRASFCRPALKIIKEIVLEGKSPHQLYHEYIAQNQNTDPQKGLINEDYKFLLSMPEKWENFHIPDERTEEAQLDEAQRRQKIVEIISKITNPVVKHRLLLFYKKLEVLAQKYGEPDRIILEFPRDPEESLSSLKEKKRQQRIQKENEESNRKAKEKLKEFIREGIKIDGAGAITKIRLWMEQGGRDPYSLTGETIGESDINNCEIDHIVPREMGGPDAYFNKVLTTAENNRAKKKQTPYQWLGKDPDTWKKFVNYIHENFKRTDKSKQGMSKRKIELLTSENAEELAEKYTHLASTSYISKLAQKICHLFFGWEQQTKGSTRRVFIVSGYFTEKIRTIFELDEILYQTNENALTKEELEKKNRANKLHHALDALVLSITNEIKFDPLKSKDEYPSWFGKEFCKKALEHCIPRTIRYKKPKLAETIYGLREYNIDTENKGKKKGKKQYVFVTRFGEGTRFKDYEDINFARKYVDSIYSYNIRNDLKKKLEENPSPEEWKVFLHNYRAGGKPKKLLLMVTKDPIDEDEVKKFLNGEIKNLGEFIKGKMPGQYLKQSKESHGYFVYKNEKGKWVREVIYAFESPYKKKKEIMKKLQGKGDVYFFRTGQTVKLENDVSSKGVVRLTKGYYYLNTVRDDNFCKLTSLTGEKSDTLSLDILMEQGKMRLAQEE